MIESAQGAGYLQRGRGLVVADAVTTRRAEWLAALGADEGGPAPASLSAIS